MMAENQGERAQLLYHLGLGHYYRYQITRVSIDLEIAIQQYQESLDNVLSTKFFRLEAGKRLLMIYAERQNWIAAYNTALQLVSLVQISRHEESSARQKSLKEVGDIASNAAAVSLSAGNPPYEAVRLLEACRGIMIGSSNEMRVDISDLEREHAVLANEFVESRDHLDTPIPFARQDDQLLTPDVLLDQLKKQLDTADQLKKTSQAIRNLHGFNHFPEFDRFLTTLSMDNMMMAAACGPVIIINISVYRCDALIIEKSKIIALPLMSLRKSDVEKRATALNPESINTELLKWLWETIAKPVLDELGFTHNSRNQWPRIWWIPTGPLAKFPLHAAGNHHLGSLDNVMDRVISSYSPSVRVLIQSRQNSANITQKPQKAVLIGMPELRYALAEVEKTRSICSSMRLEVSTPRPYLNEVLDTLKDCQIFHFAGHGRTDPDNPSKSALLLHNGEALTVAHLFEANLRRGKPFLAYLSACGTGQIKSDGLIDESLHLIAACQLAGFRHVIGTLWEVNDSCCVDVASTFYEVLEKKNLSDESVSEGLHQASRALRTRWVSENTVRATNRTMSETKSSPISTDRLHSSQSGARDTRDFSLEDDIPLYWVPFVHFGN
jgi:hypothetical protein